MNTLKKIISLSFAFFAGHLFFSAVILAADNINDNINTVKSNSNKSIQTVSGEVNVKGAGGINFDGTTIDWKNPENWSGKEQFGSAAGNNKLRFEGNRLIVSYPGYGDFYQVDFDGAGNFVRAKNLKGKKEDMELNKSYGGQYGVCLGDNNACKVWNWGYLKLKTNNCSFSCDQRNRYNYTFEYEQLSKGSNVWNTMDTAAVNKCDKIHLKPSLVSEWFANLSHACSYQTEKLYTLDFTSPPTMFASCANPEACLANAPEHNLTSTTWGKGVQKIPDNFITTIQNSLLPAEADNSVECKNGECFYKSAGIKKLTSTIPETSYFGQCRGGVVEENVEGKMTKLPEIKITTEETKVPSVQSTVDFNVTNRPPTTTVTLPNRASKLGEELDVYCDALDPDDCVDKISKVTLSCQDSKGDTSGCSVYDSTVGVLSNSLIKEIASDKQTNPFRLAAKFKVTKPGSYIVICNAMDNNGASSDYPDGSDNGSGIGVAGITVNSDGAGASGGVIDASMRFCSFTADKGLENSVCDPEGDGKDVKLSLGAIYNINPKNYKWNCGYNDKKESVSSTEKNYNCKYSAGSYNPSLEIEGEDGKITTCKAPSQLKVATQKSCRV